MLQMYENKLNNILKISTILIVLLCSKNLLAQDVTLSLNLKNVTVKEALEQYNQPLKEAILTTTYRLARNELAVKAQYQTYEKKLTPEERNIFIDIFTYTSKILTNTKKRDQAEETLEALNRIIKDNNGLKTWALGMSDKYKAMLERAKERKSAQYYRTVVYNDIIENSAAIIADGTKRAALLDGDRTDLFKFDWSQFDE